MEEKIKILRMVFRISCGAFKFMETIQLATIGYIIPNKIKSLHEMALLELEKQDPDLKVIDYFIEEINKLKNPDFTKVEIDEKEAEHIKLNNYEQQKNSSKL